MSLQDQTLSIAFNKGVNTKGDRKQIIPGQLDVLENGVFTNIDEITKRNGYTALSTVILDPKDFPVISAAPAPNRPAYGNITAGNALGVFNDNDLVILDGKSAFSFSPQNATSSNAGSKVSTKIAQMPIINVPSIGAPATVSDSAGVELVTYYPLGTAKKFQRLFIDSDTKALLKDISDSVSALSSSEQYRSNELFLFASPFVFPIEPGQWLNVVQYDKASTANSQIKAQTFSKVSMSATNEVIVANSFAFTGAAPLPPIVRTVVTATNFFCLYVDTSRNLVLHKFTNLLVSAGSVTISTDPDISHSSLYYDATNNRILITYTTFGVGVSTAVYNTSLVSIVAPHLIYSSTTAQNTAMVTSVNTRCIFIETGTFYIQGLITEDYANTTPALRITRADSQIGHQTLIHSAPFAKDNKFYLPVRFPGYNTTAGFIGQSYFVLQFNPELINPIVRTGTAITVGVDSVAAKFSYNTAFSGYASPPIAQTITNSDGSYTIPFLKSVNTSVLAGVVSSLYTLAELSLTFDLKFQTSPLGLNLNITGSVPSIYDGRGVAESGFNLPCDIATVTTVAGSITAGTYAYYALYEWTDIQGNIHRGSPTTGTSVTVGAATSVRFFVPYLGLSEVYKRSNVKIKIYRTTNGGTIPYLIQTYDNSLDPAVNIVDLTTQRIRVSDNLNDSQIIGNQQLYTIGGEVENIAPVSLSSFTSFKNRLVGISMEDPLIWWFSKQVLQGFPVEFSDLFTQAIDQRGGPITALAAMDDKLVFFKEYNLFYVTGDGPAPSGANNDFSYPQIITTDVGCINPNSVVLMPNGLMFQSHKGIYLLDRGLTTSYIGAPVEQYNGITITSATVVPKAQQARFTLASGVILVYDYLVGQWSVFTNLNEVDSIVYDDKYTVLQSNGLVLKETAGLYTDNDAAIPLKVVTGWFSFANLQGYQRVKEFLILGESNSSTSMTVSLAHDFISTINQTNVIPITASERMQHRIFPQKQKSESMQITISDSPTAPLGEGLRLSALGFTVGVKKGLNKTAASNSSG